MPFAVGDIIEAVIAKIVPYGAFVNLPEGKRGLIHISEIANAYVTDVNQYLKEKQTIKVRVLQISPDERKIDLSVKQVEHPGETRKPPSRRAGPSSRPTVNAPSMHLPGDPANIEDLYLQIKASDGKGGGEGVANEFEDRLTKFLKTSEEKLSDVRKNLEAKRGGGGKRGKY